LSGWPVGFDKARVYISTADRLIRGWGVTGLLSSL
jgi:hypothetical protein